MKTFIISKLKNEYITCESELLKLGDIGESEYELDLDIGDGT
jgi:hypothetical protein